MSISEFGFSHVPLPRRKLLAMLGAVAVTTQIVGCGGPSPSPDGPSTGEAPSPDAPTSYEAITHYNNFYEFSTGKEDVAERARGFRTAGWTVEVGGLVGKPATFALDELLRRFPPEERTYRMRCVEGWSMVIPWQGFPLANLLRAVEPTTQARFVRFEALLDPSRMPGQKTNTLDWPYVEGLRLDEATHSLTILATGIEGKPLPPQSGAPIRLVVPWKYGFKSIKSVVKIELVGEMPMPTWMEMNPREYGFYANVNPDVPHPRWPQSSERRIGEIGRRATLLFNGYADQVADLYKGMDLRKDF